MAPLRVLILEDDPDIIDLIRSVLSGPFECFTASNGMEGLQQVELGQPDLVLCDIMMPVMDGHEFIKRVHMIPALASLPVIFLSALSTADHIKNGYARGAALYLTKPIDPARLKRNVELFVRDHDIEPRPKRFTLDQLAVINLTGPDAPSGSTQVRPPSRNTPEATASPATPVPPTRPMSAPATPVPPTRATTPPATPSPAPTTPATPAPAAAPSAAPAAAANTSQASQGSQRYLNAINVRQGKEMADRNTMPPRLRILVVEDDRDTCNMLRVGLATDYEFLETNDGITAIEFAVRYKPDIFIIDGMLPRMTGYQLAVMLKKNREFFRSPIIFMSGKATTRDQVYVQKLGIAHFLAKPFTMKQVDAILAQIKQTPGFALRTERLPFSQVGLEQFQNLETHRGALTNVDQLERKSLENSLKKQLH